ncbi:ergothioneine biosynthesis glutamate--cysteine ligase EgtA [Pseudonocardia sp. HH130630-07]|uniref:ergothioneine biosynthesis glutamate--cysteine ligase EgtA n=1 Tax=Pseudonocardia sp. HH130630-07 TaxID=1690815 RepID=UPI000839B2FD|nr:ergothioneine biosynthesis glutamate--cysteine ligase EgtA [Pseudonocardia sp. HH130630-07]
MTAHASAGRGDGVLRSRAAAEAYVASVCFKHGPPALVGVEIEWMLHRPARPAEPIDPDTLRAALGAHAPPALDPGSDGRPLPAGGAVTVEPGGQVEISSAPASGLTSLVGDVSADTAHLHRLLARHGLRPHARAADPVRPARRVLDLPRYAAMECVFDRVGPHGRSGMCSTSAVQFSLDAGPAASVAERWAVLHEIGPVLLAAFANSPVQHGRRTGWKSSRQACWLSLDPARTAPPPVGDTDPATTWARRVVDTPLLCVPRAGSWDVPPGVTFGQWASGQVRDGVLARPPTRADLDYHVSTLFPPVRPQGHLEVRYVDGQPGDDWTLPAAVLLALTSSPAIVDRAREICEPVRDAWVTAARDALADPALGAAAAALFPLAHGVLRAAGTPLVTAPGAVLSRLAEVTEYRVLRGRCPADEPFPLERDSGGPPAVGFPRGLYLGDAGPDRTATRTGADPRPGPGTGTEPSRIEEGVR